MLEYINEEEYKELLGVESVPNDFNNLVIQASAIINKKTYNRIKVVDEKIKYVTCLVVNVLAKSTEYQESVGNLSSTNIEGWSETYKSGTEITVEKDNEIDDILHTFLWDTGLLTLGVVLSE